MNPLNWRREHQVALLIGGAVGICIGLLVGYMYDSLFSMFVVQVSANRTVADAPRSVGAWLGSGSSFRWGAFGALVAGALIYTRQLLHA
jgi:hypothetical protein